MSVYKAGEAKNITPRKSYRVSGYVERSTASGSSTTFVEALSVTEKVGKVSRVSYYGFMSTGAAESHEEIGWIPTSDLTMRITADGITSTIRSSGLFTADSSKMINIFSLSPRGTVYGAATTSTDTIGITAPHISDYVGDMYFRNSMSILFANAAPSSFQGLDKIKTFYSIDYQTE